MVAMDMSLTALGRYDMQQQLHPAPVYRGSAGGQAYIARYAVGYIGGFEQLALHA